MSEEARRWIGNTIASCTFRNIGGWTICCSQYSMLTILRPSFCLLNRLERLETASGLLLVSWKTFQSHTLHVHYYVNLSYILTVFSCCAWYFHWMHLLRANVRTYSQHTVIKTYFLPLNKFSTISGWRLSFETHNSIGWNYYIEFRLTVFDCIFHRTVDVQQRQQYRTILYSTSSISHRSFNQTCVYSTFNVAVNKMDRFNAKMTFVPCVRKLRGSE